MSISYKLVPKRNPSNPEASQKYYAQTVYNSKVKLKGLAEKISRTTTMGKADVIGVLTALEEEIIDVLKSGSSVELGGLCTFYPSVKSEGVDSPDDFNAGSHIKKKSISIRAKKSLIDQIQSVSVEKKA